MTKTKTNDGYLKNIGKPLWQLDDEALHEIFDVNWFPRANEALSKQRKIWDFNYLAYKGIMLWSEINRKRRSNGFGIYVNVPRTFMTIEGIRRNINLDKLLMDIEKMPDIDNITAEKINKLSNLLNYDLSRSGTKGQVRDAGFNKFVFGNGYLHTYLINHKGKYGTITGKIDPETGRIKSKLDEVERQRYYGLASRSESPYNVFPDPDGVTLDVDDHTNELCKFHCIRKVKHIETFKRNWRGIVPEKLLNKVKPGGDDMTNYESVREQIDYLFSYDKLRYPGTVEDAVTESNISKEYNGAEYVEERLWIGEDFTILQAGSGLPFLLVSPNPLPDKRMALTKLDNVRIPGEYFALGEPYIMRYQQIEENRVHNSILDNVHMAISGMMGINTQYLEDKADTEVFPGKIWKFKNIPGMKIEDVIQSFQPGTGAIAGALKFNEEVKRTGQSATSITDFVTGASKSLASTATEASKLSSASDIAIIDKIREMAEIAFVDVCKNMISMYPIAYTGQKIELAAAGQKIFFFGKTREEATEKEIQVAITKYGENNIFFKDDTDISNPKIKVIGNIEVSKDFKFKQIVGAVDFSIKINEQAYNTGDPRRIDVVKLGLDGLEQFEVIATPKDYLMEGQMTKVDEMKEAAAVGINKQNQGEGGGAPKKNKIDTNPASSVKQNSQPNNRGKNKSSKKNV